MKPFLVAGGAQQFKSKTSFIFSSRTNKDLTAIDKPLAMYPGIPVNDYLNRTGCLVSIITSASSWIDGKQEKLDARKTSRRYPTVKSLLDEAVAELKLVKGNHNWAKLRDARAKIIPDGSVATGMGGKVAAMVKNLEVKSTIGTGGRPDDFGENNWLEVLDKDHHRGHEISQLFKTWANNSTETRSFWEYIQDPGQKKLLPDSVKVRYVEDLAIRTLFELDFQNGRIYSKMNPVLQNYAVSANRTRKFLFDYAGDAVPLNTTAWPSQALRGLSNGWAAYVLSTHQIAYAGVHVGGVFHHSSFLCGAPVLAAGMIKVENGTLKEIHEKNGHYQSQEFQLKSFLRFLKSKLPGLNLSAIPVHRFAGGTNTAAEILGDTASKDARANRLIMGTPVVGTRVVGQQ